MTNAHDGPFTLQFPPHIGTHGMYVIEASTAGLDPGSWPDVVCVPCAEGEPQKFRLSNMARAFGELTHVDYAALDEHVDARPTKLRIYND